MTRVLPAAAVFAALLCGAQEAAVPVVKSAAEVDWKASGSLPPGTEYHLIYEDPSTHAVQTLVRMPRGYVLPRHSHSHDETILVLKGKVTLDFGGASRTVAPGGYAVIPAGTAFTLTAGGFGGAQFLAAFNGPFDVKAP